MEDAPPRPDVVTSTMEPRIKLLRIIESQRGYSFKQMQLTVFVRGQFKRKLYCFLNSCLVLLAKPEERRRIALVWESSLEGVSTPWSVYAA